MSKYYYTNGSSAYSLDKYDIENYYTKKRINEEEAKKARAVRSAKLRMRTIAAILAVFAVACTILYRNVAIIEASTEAQQLEEKLTTLQAANTKLNYELKKEVDLKKVEEIATTKLGMKRPDKHQTVYVDVTQKNYAEVKNSTADKTLSGTFSVIKQKVINVLEYLQ